MTDNPTARVHLDGLGYVPAVRADELRVGDEAMWGHGVRTGVLAIHTAAPGSLALVLTTWFGPPYTRVTPVEAPVAAFRRGRWIGGAPIVRMACRVSMSSRGKWVVCSSTVDEFGRCGKGHYPPPDRVAIEYPRP